MVFTSNLEALQRAEVNGYKEKEGKKINLTSVRLQKNDKKNWKEFEIFISAKIVETDF